MTGKLITEFIGTFFLVFIIGMSSLCPPGLAPVAIGIGLACVVYMGGHISGAHYNPAVSLAVWLRGSIGWGQMAGYMCIQIAGATLGAILATKLASPFMPTPADLTTPWPALAVEVLFTFMLALVVLNVATAKGTAGNSYFGLAIGGTVLAAAAVGGHVSGGAYNPSVGLGAALAHWGHEQPFPSHVWIYVVGPLVGGALAAYAFKAQHSWRE